MARPTIYTKKLGNKICSRIADGESLKKITSDSQMPARSTVHLWLLDEDKKEFSDNYEKAVNIRADNKFDELEEIADNTEGDVQRDRLRIDTRKWWLSKVMPKKYGEKQEVKHSGDLTVQIEKSLADKYNVEPGTRDNSERQA